jgi:hypothetical protein
MNQVADITTKSQLRRGIEQACNAFDQTGRAPDRKPAFTYVPPSHARALDPEVTLVVGIRGAGKSFWAAQLASPAHRAFVKAAYPEVRFAENIKVTRGFGMGLSNTDAPGKDVLADLLVNHKPRAIWRAVLACSLGFDGTFAELTNWSQRVDWVQSNAEEFDRQIEKADLELAAQNRTHLVLFDALDRMADDWDDVSKLARALLQVALDVRSTNHIRFKVFVRPDIIDNKEIMSFPDASKLLGHRADLTWRRADLYALLYQCLANSDQGGQPFRERTAEVADITWKKNDENWIIPSLLRTDELFQERVFHKMTGPAMGATTKRGKPYSWLVSHLQDGLDQVSPRSFFAALKTAACESAEASNYTLDYRTIQIGVQRASEIRVTEITDEDYPWVDLVMAPLNGQITVPCEAQEFIKIWRGEGTIKHLQEKLTQGNAQVKLPPQNLEDGPKGVLHDLEALGIVQTMTDGRIQMPDVYRIGFGFGRKGGIKPLK